MDKGISYHNKRERNVEVFNDTLDVIKNSEKLTKSLEETLKSQKLILEKRQVIMDNQNFLEAVYFQDFYFWQGGRAEIPE